ncbi:hypothetical protein [Wolbachia endosymbiont of Aedes albopictus]|uniref:hypothetical protein n=1 Tax=Wolbachia endosymbiont of Aedes albopictus TaxID=167957 RepID=UPI000BBCC7E2|nr:hypothetical protein [Wolbachia endosymbiont of Aedes albopictus]UVW84465.1 hypothetical protein NHG98_03210 [Wolbachia endosymbiont of Aedes albopictus]
MPIYIRFENNKQVETTVLENKPGGEKWYEAPENFDWQKSYCLTEGGKIVERNQEDIELELLENAKLSALSSLRAYYDNYTHQYAGASHQKSKSYEIQAKAAANILAAPESIDEKDAEIIEPLAKVREISTVQMAELIQEKAKKAVKAIIKCEELEDLAKKKIKEIKDREELQSFLNNFKEQVKNSLANL